MKHDKRKLDVDRSPYFVRSFSVIRRLPPTGSGRRWCSDQTYYHFEVAPERKKVRCPSCRKILLLQEVHCVGGELLGFKIPMHKTKPKTYKRPKGDRRGARSRRG